MFAPTVDEVYPPGFDTVVSVGAIAAPLEGAARPGHFDGVATVVAILFALVGAERAYFGAKDYQQVQVIRRMALDLALPTEVVTMPTRSARRTGWRCRRATRGSRRGSGRGAGHPPGAGGRRFARRAGEREAAARPRGDLPGAGLGAAGEPEYVSVADPDTLGGAGSVEAGRCCRWRPSSTGSA